jgi:hypothetical protein
MQNNRNNYTSLFHSVSQRISARETSGGAAKFRINKKREKKVFQVFDVAKEYLIN